MSPRVTALIMAASRRGADDPVAKLQGVSHKCLVDVGGTAMIARVVETLRATPSVGRVFISIESPQILRQVPALATLLANGDIGFVESRATLAESVLAALPVIAATGSPYPLLITTADNALHTPEIVGAFVDGSLETPHDVSVGMTAAVMVLAHYPNGQRAFHHFRDGAYSSCNIYMLHTPEAATAAQAFAGGGQFGKKPWRLVAAFGLGTFLLHMLKRLTLRDAMTRIGRGMKLDVREVLMPFAEGPIDIDSPADHALAEEILRKRA